MIVQSTYPVVVPHSQDTLVVDVSSMTGPTTGLRVWLNLGLKIVESKGDPEKRLRQIGIGIRSILRAVEEPI